MIEEKTPKYIKELKNDLIGHIDQKIDSSIGELAITIYNTVALKEDIKNMATKDDIKNMATKDDINLIWENMVTKEDIKDMATKSDVNKILTLIGSYEVRSKNIEEIILEDHKPRIIDLEKVVYQ